MPQQDQSQEAKLLNQRQHHVCMYVRICLVCLHPLSLSLSLALSYIALGSVRATSVGFLKMRDTPPQDQGNAAAMAAASEHQRLQQHEEEMWQMGQKYSESH